MNDKVELPKKLLRQWMALFLENKQVDQKIDVEMDKDRVVNLDPDNIESSASVRKALVESKSSLKLLDRIENIDPTMLDGIRVLDEKEFKEYLDGNGDWKFGGYEEPLCVTLLYRSNDFNRRFLLVLKK